MKRSSYFIILILFAFFESDAQKGQYLMLPEFRFIINPDSFFVHEISNDFNSIPSGLNVYFYNQTYELEIKIETGYLPSQANWKYSINNTDFPVSPLEKEHYSRQRLYANTTHEVKKINGHTFNWNLTFTEECSSTGKADLYEIDVLYDSIFDNFSFVRIWVSASTVYSGYLSKYIRIT